MEKEPDAELKKQFLGLLLKADPNVEKRRALTEDFAGRLAAFTQNWANGAKDIDDQQEALRKWIESSLAKPVRPKVMVAGAAAGGSRARRRPAKKR